MEILYSQIDETIACNEKIQLVESQGISEVESDNLIESGIDPFETMYEEMDEDNDQIYSPLFSDKAFLNEDWHKYRCTESCAATGNSGHGCESLEADIQSIREIDESGCTLLSENGNMLTNMAGSSILKSTDHTDQVKLGNLSVRFILEEGEPCSDNLSDSEQSEGTSDSEDEWQSCVSSVEKDEYFYDAVSLVNSYEALLNCFSTRSLISNFETNLDGLAMGCRQPSQSDQVPVTLVKMHT